MIRRRAVIAVALLTSLALWLPATFASACDACGEFSGAQAIARMTVAFSPMWLLMLAGLAFRFRAAFAVLVAALILMATVTLALGTDLRAAFAPLGLSSAGGFVAYSVPFAVAAVVAVLDLHRGTPLALTDTAEPT